MGGFSNTILAVLQMYPDEREEVQIPIMTRVQMEQFVKHAVRDIPDAHKPFNEVFGGKRRASAYPAPVRPDAGVPTFGWLK